MDFLIIMLAFFFALLMCLGLILMKWVISQIGITVFLLVLFLILANLCVAAWFYLKYKGILS